MSGCCAARSRGDARRLVMINDNLGALFVQLALQKCIELGLAHAFTLN
jgi:hypothetical protein